MFSSTSPNAAIPSWGTISSGISATAEDLPYTPVIAPNVQNFEPERLIQVSWDGLEQESYHTKIRILCKNIRGVLAKISTLLADQGLNIDSGQFRSNVDSRTLLHFTVETTDAKQLYETLEKLNSMDFVLEAVRE